MLGRRSSRPHFPKTRRQARLGLQSIASASSGVASGPINASGLAITAPLAKACLPETGHSQEPAQARIASRRGTHPGVLPGWFEPAVAVVVPATMVCQGTEADL